MPSQMSTLTKRTVLPSGVRAGVAIVVVCCTALSAPALAPAARPVHDTSQPLPPQGLYEGCAPEASGEVCIDHLATIRAAGFRYVLNYSSWYGSPAAVLRYAEAAAALGLQLIWPLNNPAWRGLGNLGATYSGLGEQRPLSNAEFSSFAVGLVADLPATWGFYIGDELPRAEAGRVRELGESVRALAPGKPQLYVARPGIAHLEPFAHLADVAGADAYPVGSGDPSVRQVAQSAQIVTTAAGVGTAMVLQAFSWSQYRPSPASAGFPSRRKLTAMRNAAIRHADPTMILWYSYQDILRSEDPKGHWHDLIGAAFARSARSFRKSAPNFSIQKTIQARLPTKSTTAKMNAPAEPNAKKASPYAAPMPSSNAMAK